MKVTEKFLKVYEDVLKGIIPLTDAQRMFCGSESKNKWYNLKSRLKTEVQGLEAQYGVTEKEASKRALPMFTNSRKFLYLYEKVLKGEISIVEAQHMMCEQADNLNKWYNTKAKEKESVAKLEKKYKKTIVKGRVIDLVIGKKAPTKIIEGDTIMKSDRVRQVAAKGEETKVKRGRKPKKVQAVEETAVTKGVRKPGKTVQVVEETAVTKEVRKPKKAVQAVEEKVETKGLRKPVAGMPSIKAYFIKLYEEMLKGNIPESDMREKFEGTEGVNGKWNTYKYVSARKEVDALKNKYAPKNTTKVVETVTTNSATNDAVETDGEAADSADKKSEKGASKGKATKASKGTKKATKGKTAVKNSAKVIEPKLPNKKEAPKKEIPKKEKTNNTPTIVGVDATQVALHNADNVKAELVNKIVQGKRTSSFYIFISEYIKMKEGIETEKVAKDAVIKAVGKKAAWYTTKHNYEKLLIELDNVYETRKSIFTVEEIEQLRQGLKIEVSDINNKSEDKRVKTEEVQNGVDVNFIKSLGVSGVSMLEDISVGEILYTEPTVEEDIATIRNGLLKKYKSNEITKAEMRDKGKFDTDLELDKWLKRKLNTNKSINIDIEKDEDGEDTSIVRNKSASIINPNTKMQEEGFVESKGEIEQYKEEIVEDTDVDEDIDMVENDEYYDELDDVVDEAEEEQLMETIANEVRAAETQSITKDIKIEKDSLADLIKEARAEQKKEHEGECPYNCINGKILLESRGYVPCPHCMGIERKAELLNESNEVNIFDLLKIPPQYRGITSVADDVLSDLRTDVYMSNSVMEVTTLLNNMVQSVRNSRVYGLSSYIHISNFVDIRRYVYGLQREAVANGVGTVPYISLNTLAALLYASNTAADGELDEKLRKDRLMLGNIAYTTNAFKRLSEDFPCDYYDYCKAPLVILEATAETLKRGWSALADLLAERTREGLPTVVFGYAASTAPQVVNELKWLVGDNPNRLDLLTIVELKTEKGGLGKRNFNNIENVRGTNNAGLQIPSMVDEKVEVRKAKDVLRGK